MILSKTRNGIIGSLDIENTGHSEDWKNWRVSAFYKTENKEMHIERIVENFMNPSPKWSKLLVSGNEILAAVNLSQYSSTWILLLVGVVTLVVALVSYGSRRKKAANFPPGPRNWPVIGAFLDMDPALHKTCDKFAAKYGAIVMFRLGVQTMVVVSSPEAAEELLKHKDAEFSHRLTAMNRSASKYTGVDGKVFAFANYEAEFKLLRKLLVAENFTLAKMKTYEELRTQEMAVMVEKIFSVPHIVNGSDNNSIADDPAPIGIRLIATDMIRNIVFSLFLGKRFDSLPPADKLREFPDLMEEVMKIFMEFNLVDFFPWLTWLDPQGLLKRMKKYSKRQGRFHELIIERNRQELKHKRESGIWNDADEGSSTSFIQVLLRAQQEGTITDKGIMATMETILSASIDTTASQTEWVLLELARHPNMLRRLQQEIDGVVGKQSPLEEADLEALPFLNALILESSRLHGIVPFSLPHVNLRPSTLCGYDIPANTAVLLNSYSIARDPKVWKDPLQFNPDRFMAAGGSSADPTLSSETIKANGLYYNLLPFSSGRRGCPGYNLAIVMLLRTIGTLVHAFDWSPPPGSSPENLSIDEVGQFLLHPSSDLYLIPTPRLSSHVYKSCLSDKVHQQHR